MAPFEIATDIIADEAKIKLAHDRKSSSGSASLIGREVRQQSPPDRRLPGRGIDLLAGQVSHIERIDRLFAKSDDMGGADVEIEA